MTTHDVLDALREARRMAGSQQALADMAGISQSTLAGYFSGRYDIGNMTLATLLKVFPNMQIGSAGHVSVHGDNNGAIAAGNFNVAVSGSAHAVVGASSAQPDAGRTAVPADVIDRNALEIKIMESKNLSPEEQVKFVLFLKREIR